MKQMYFKYLNVVNQTNQYQYNAEANNETSNERYIAGVYNHASSFPLGVTTKLSEFQTIYNSTIYDQHANHVTHNTVI